MKLVFLIVLAICTVARCQRRPFQQTNMYPRPVNPDAIYFDDNIPQSNIRDNHSSADVPDAIIDKFSQNNLSQQDVLVQPIKENIKGDSAKALTSFSLNMMKYINLQNSGNTVASPYSVATLLSLLQQGSTGMGLEQITAVLQMNARTSAAAFRGHVGDLQSRSSRNVIRSANNIFLANAFNLNPEFRTSAQRDYNSDVTPTSFLNSVQVANDINRWVSSRTNSQITEIVTPDMLSMNTQMVLVNAVYFKGVWDVPFRRQSTKVGKFRLPNGATTDVEYMHSRRYLKSGRDAGTGSTVVVLPFDADEYSLMIILPSTLTNVRDTMSFLTVEQLEEYSNLTPLEVMLDLPKFTVKSDMDLVPLLKNMGITKMFQQRSDLTNFGTYRSQNPQISSAAHSAVLSIDEEGGTAAAATSFAAVALSNNEPSMIIQVNRPFIAVLWDTKAKIPLFLATIQNPAV